jgi:2-oxoglutarate dehydrogenase E1 component
MIQDLLATSHLFAGNAPYVEGLYEEYRRDPGAVPDAWRAWFDQLTGQVSGPARPRQPPPPLAAPPAPAHSPDDTLVLSPSGEELLGVPAQKQSGVRQLIMSYRILGHMAAELDPIKLRGEKHVRALDLQEHSLSEEDLDTVFDTGNMAGPKQAPLREIIHALRRTYTDHVGVEYTHINDLDQRNWIRERLERTHSRAAYSPEFRRHLLQRVTAAEGLERFMHSRYTGQKRFSLEGAESLIPLLDNMIERCGSNDVKEIVLGMAHRGRLNVLVNIMGKVPHDLFKQFEGKYDAMPGSGDVKYHEGYSANVHTASGRIHVALAFNPSHLEIIDPVVEGSVRARQDRRGDFHRRQVIPLLIHGDAAIAGQGVVYETFNLAQTRGFTTGGTLHIVINNQIGFTLSNPLDTRSTLYCTDIAKVVQAPVFHVNGDDPEAVAFVAQLAVDYRMTFSKDVVIDLVCYRRHGHNEADEPAATQPMMYQKIGNHQTTREIYARRLVDEGVCAAEEPDRMVEAFRKELEDGDRVGLHVGEDTTYEYSAEWSDFIGRSWNTACDTRVSLETIRRLGNVLTTVPEGFVLHPRLRKVIDDRRKMIAGALPMDWGCAENLAYATLLDEGYRVRLTGQDSGRGTFFHRHAVLHCNRTGTSYVPLQELGDGQAWFTIVDSILSEEAVLGYEYGYSTTNPDALVVWEAQFGDFTNGAQVVIDQFLSSSEQKWGRLSGLVLMLPHGWEGQGPEHTSARLERFLQLCAEENLQVANPTTPAQMFHLLRREMVRPYRKPLVIMSPKSTLRRKISFSSLEDLSKRGFQTVIGEAQRLPSKGLRRVVLCSGKVYYDLLEARQERGIKDIALARLEQLYPHPEEDLARLLKKHAGVSDLVWCQEEPQNQGAWYGIQHVIRRCMQPGQNLVYAGRAASAAPSGGHLQKHLERQKRLIDQALTLDPMPAVRILPTNAQTPSIAAK